MACRPGGAGASRFAGLVQLPISRARSSSYHVHVPAESHQEGVCTVIERGDADYSAMGEFELDRHLPRRPARSLKGIVRGMLRHSRV